MRNDGEDVLYVSDQDGSLSQFPELARRVAARKDWPLPRAYLRAFAESGAAGAVGGGCEGGCCG